MVLTVSLIVMAVLGYLGKSLVMMASIAGIAVALWILSGRPLSQQLLGILIGAVAMALLAEVVHLVHHRILGDQPDHGGFWLSAFLVGSINALTVGPVVWFAKARGRQQGREAARLHGS